VCWQLTGWQSKLAVHVCAVNAVATMIEGVRWHFLPCAADAGLLA
jgi:hypothetical protein